MIFLIISCSSTLLSWFLSCSLAGLMDIYDISGIYVLRYVFIIFYMIMMMIYFLLRLFETQKIISFIFLSVFSSLVVYSPSVFIGEGTMMKKYAWPC